MASGAAYCQLTDILFRNKIILKKVKFNPRSELDSLNNWKLLTTAWKEIGVDKPVNVEKLMKAKFQDNFEFLQWFYKFFNANYDGAPYDPVEARGGEALPASGKGGAAPAARPAVARAPLAQRPAPATTQPAAAAAVKKTTPLPPTKNGAAAPAPAKAAAGDKSGETAEVKELRALLAEQQEVAVTIENERDFYFNKLRRVEVMCTSAKEKGVQVDIDKVLSVLYATEDVPPEDEESIVDEHNENIQAEPEQEVEEPKAVEPEHPPAASSPVQKPAAAAAAADDDEETF
ncbi:hypothetical protein WR25_21458 isoform B [Diploscapter pachys]|uniref:EB1 C-terminal domain-containing protein n=2 Tax=Diploscapter pachys TaxID=2018661 RepID=A0A2A2JEY0_9BILA|nr:hypothetical protein WR25_21458 isoform B [Diploscapter pachys]